LLEIPAIDKRGALLATATEASTFSHALLAEQPRFLAAASSVVPRRPAD
jgi:hypothetical protein